MGGCNGGFRLYNITSLFLLPGGSWNEVGFTISRKGVGVKRVFLVSAVVVAWGCIILLSVSPAIAGCYPDNNNPCCEGNFDYDCDVDGSDASTFKSDFGRSGLSTPCPSSGSALVPKTGQTTSYATGDDGDLEKGVAWPNPRFTDNGDGTVTDNLTGLFWLKNANCFGTRTWNNALSDCNGLSAAGYCGLTDGSGAGDWRLPNHKELFSLIDAENFGPALPVGHPFTNVQSYYYWSSTTLAYSINGAWGVNMSDGYVYNAYKTNIYYVWPVRGGH
jgi:hypothetical protein